MTMMMKDMILLHESVNVYDGKKHITGAYGPQLLLDCHGCDPSTFNRESIEAYTEKLCELMKMDAEDFHFWDDTGLPPEERQTEPHAKGTSFGCVGKTQIGLRFIITSSIVIHTLDWLERVYVDIFSCKLFDDGEATQFTWDWFKADSVGNHLIQRH